MYELKLENESGNIVDLNDGINYVVLAADGLTPPPASIFTAKSPNRVGAKYNGHTIDVRNIDITIKILGDVEANRNALYAWTDTGQYCKVHYKNGVKNVYCEGHVEESPIDLFTDNEVAAVSILCENPYWKALQEIVTDISSVLRQFTLPCAISSAGVPFSTYRQNNTTGVFNAGAETGARFTVKCVGEVKDLRIFNAGNTAEQFRINYTFPAGWYIVIDTEASPKTCTGYAPNSPAPVNLIRYIAPNPTWFVLKKGANSFGYTTDGENANVEITIEHNTQYLGV